MALGVCSFRLACLMLGDFDPTDIIPAKHDLETRRRRLTLMFACWLACRVGRLEPHHVDALIDPSPANGIRDGRVHTWISYLKPYAPEHLKHLDTFIGMYKGRLKGADLPPAHVHIREQAFRQWLSLIKPKSHIASAATAILAKEITHDPAGVP